MRGIIVMRAIFGPILLFGVGLAGAVWAQGIDRFDGSYVGELTLQGVVSGDCTEPPLGAVYPLIVSQGRVSFAYLPRFATTLAGPVDKAGAFKATARTKTGLVQMTGRISGLKVVATIQSPSCRYSFQTR